MIIFKNMCENIIMTNRYDIIKNIYNNNVSEIIEKSKTSILNEEIDFTDLVVENNLIITDNLTENNELNNVLVESNDNLIKKMDLNFSSAVNVSPVNLINCSFAGRDRVFSIGYQQIGNFIKGYGIFDAISATSNNISFEFSVPFASNFSDENDINGSIIAYGSSGSNKGTGALSAVVGTDRVLCQISSDLVILVISCNFFYKI